MNRLFLLLSFLFLSPAFGKSQPLSIETKTALKDSIILLYEQYNKLFENYSQMGQKMENYTSDVGNLQKGFTNLNSLLDENTKAVQQVTKEVMFTYESQYKIRKDKIINTADFIETANQSLNSIILLNEVTEYLNEITKLNSPVNQDLGFSLSDEVLKIVEGKVIKGRKKINGGKSGKILSFVGEIIRSPLADVVTNAVPAVASIKSIVDMVIGIAVQGDDVSVEEVAAFKDALKDYIQHYEGLAGAQTKFDNTLNTLTVRKVALSQLMKQYTVDRANAIQPQLIDINTMPLLDLINKHYNKENIVNCVRSIEEQYSLGASIGGKENAFKLGLNDKKLNYPVHAESQARFIRDEILNISNEYVAAYNQYQAAIESVLKNSLEKNIGKPALVNAKIGHLQNKLGGVIKAFEVSINPDLLNKKFDRLASF